MCHWPLNSGHHSTPKDTWSQSRHLNAKFKITTLQGVVIMWLPFQTSSTGFNEKANRESHKLLLYVPLVFPGFHCALPPLAFLRLCCTVPSTPQSTFAHTALHPRHHSPPAFNYTLPPLASLNSCMAYIRSLRASQLLLLQHPRMPYLRLPSFSACWDCHH